MATGAEILAYIKRTFKRTDKDAELYEAIEDTVKEIRRRRPADKHKNFSDLSLVDTNYRVALDADMEHFIGKAVLIDPANTDDSYPMQKITIEEYNRLEPYPDNATVDKDQPTMYAIFGDYAWVFPVSDGTYTLRLFHTEETNDLDITSATDPVPFSYRHREMLKAGVLKKIYRELGNPEQSMLWEREFEKLFRQYEIYEEDKIRSIPNQQKYHDL